VQRCEERSRYLFIYTFSKLELPGPLICNVKYPPKSNIAPSLHQLPTKVITHDTWVGKHKLKKPCICMMQSTDLHMSAKGVHTWNDIFEKKKKDNRFFSRGNNINR